MKAFSQDMLSLENVCALHLQPDKRNLLSVLKGECPKRPTLFELFLNDRIYWDVTQDLQYDPGDPYARQKRIVDACCRLGYDCVSLYGARVRFSVRKVDKHGASSVSQNVITIGDRDDFEAYQWPDVDAADFVRMDAIGKHLPDGMGYIVYGPGGVEETLVELVGYENLCYMLADEPELVEEIVEAIGTRLVRYYEICAANPYVDALIYNDDWGFNTQTLLPPRTLRALVFPWVNRIVDVIKANGKPVILHSCGNILKVMEDIITDMRFDAKHSYQDSILPVEEFYERYHDRIAVLGGMDVDFIIRSKPEQVYARACAMLERVKDRGGYALGSGNSIPEYVPTEQYLAMAAAATFNR